MVKAINIANNQLGFKASPEKKGEHMETSLLPNTLQTKIRQSFDKNTSAFTEYPVKGLRGDVNSNFYEFLSMGIIPYLVGSGMFMLVFNVLNNIKGALNPTAKKFDTMLGKKMALGVVMYGIGKTLSKPLVTKPVAIATGVDVELPYTNVQHKLPKEAGDAATTETLRQQRKIFDSADFFRKDVLFKDDPGYFDRVAKKVGLGDNLNDSVSEVTPIIRSIVSSTNTAKSLSTYSWAATGVMLAMQTPWNNFFHTISNRKKFLNPNNKVGSYFKNLGENTVNISKSFGKSLLQSCKNLWSGDAGTTGIRKHAGKAWILFSTALTAGLTANTIIRAKSMGKLSNKDIIDKNQESQVI